MQDDVTVLVSSLIENVSLLVISLLACLSVTPHTMSEQCSVFHIRLLIFDHDCGSLQLFLRPFVVKCALFKRATWKLESSSTQKTETLLSNVREYSVTSSDFLKMKNVDSALLLVQYIFFISKQSYKFIKIISILDYK